MESPVTTVTIVTCTARTLPRFDWLADSICRSVLASPINIEWVVVDAKLWYDEVDRRAELTAAVNGRLQVIHLPPKPCRWQGPNRLTQADYFALNNARNTGLIVAKGERVILLDDCTVVDDQWLAQHLKWEDRGVAGSYCSWQSADVVNGKIVKGDFGLYGWDGRRNLYSDPRPTNGGWAFGLNCSFPLGAALRANGYDERYDGQGGAEDCDGGIRFERAGTSFVWDPMCIINQILGSHEEIFGHAGWGKPALSIRRPKEAVLRRDGQSHFANELLTERLMLDDVHRFEPLGNPFSLSELRARYRATNTIKHDFESDTDWRDNQPLTEMK